MVPTNKRDAPNKKTRSVANVSVPSSVGVCLFVVDTVVGRIFNGKAVTWPGADFLWTAMIGSQFFIVSWDSMMSHVTRSNFSPDVALYTIFPYKSEQTFSFGVPGSRLKTRKKTTEETIENQEEAVCC